MIKLNYTAPMETTGAKDFVQNVAEDLGIPMEYSTHSDYFSFDGDDLGDVYTFTGCVLSEIEMQELSDLKELKKQLGKVYNR